MLVVVIVVTLCCDAAHRQRDETSARRTIAQRAWEEDGLNATYRHRALSSVARAVNAVRAVKVRDAEALRRDKVGMRVAPPA